MGKRHLIIACERLAMAHSSGRSGGFVRSSVLVSLSCGDVPSLAADSQHKRWREQSLPRLQAFQHNLPRLFWGSLDSRLSRLLAEAPSLTNFPVQFCGGALQNPLSAVHHLDFSTLPDLSDSIEFNELSTIDQTTCWASE
jgi:hypothetical protein